MLTPFENLTTERQGDVAVVRVKFGRTLGCDLRSLLKELAAQTGARYVLLDLSNVADVGSSGSPVPREPEPCMRSEVYFG
jgi:anti-anti-sigma regulatory factor